MEGNATNSTITLHLRNFPDWYANIFAVAYSGIVVVAVIGNILVCSAVAVNKSLRRLPTNMFIVSLSASDLVTAVFAMPFDVEILITQGKWYHSEALCKAWTVAYLMAVPSSIFTLLAVSIDRYKSLSDPLNRFRRAGRFMTRRRALVVILLLWVYCLIMALLPVVEAVTPHISFIYYEQCVFPLPMIFSVVTSFVNFVIPLLLTCGIYAKIYQIARSQPYHQQSVGRATIKRPVDRKDFVRNLRAAKTISMFVGAFFFCWVPYSTISIISNLCTQCFRAVPPHIYPPLLMLGYLNSALNPFLFSFRNKAFKSTLWHIYYTIRRSRRRGRILKSRASRRSPGEQESGTEVHLCSLRSHDGLTETHHEPAVNAKTVPAATLSNDGSREPLHRNDKLAYDREDTGATFI